MWQSAKYYLGEQTFLVGHDMAFCMCVCRHRYVLSHLVWSWRTMSFCLTLHFIPILGVAQSAEKYSAPSGAVENEIEKF